MFSVPSPVQFNLNQNTSIFFHENERALQLFSAKLAISSMPQYFNTEVITMAEILNCEGRLEWNRNQNITSLLFAVLLSAVRNIESEVLRL